MQKLNIPVILIGISGAIYLVPKSRDGIIEALGYEPQVALVGAIFLTLAGSIGWSVYRQTRHDLAAVLGCLGLVAAVGSDTAADWDALAEANDAPVAEAQVRVDRLSSELESKLSSIRQLLTAADALDNDGIAKNDWEVVAHRRDAAKLEVGAADLREELGGAEKALAHAQASKHLLSSHDWGCWAILAFNSICEVCLSILGFFVVSGTRREAQPELLPVSPEVMHPCEVPVDFGVLNPSTPLTLEQVRFFERTARTLRNRYRASQ